MTFQLLSTFNSRQKRILEDAWKAGTRGSRFLTNKKISQIDVSTLCIEIMKYLNETRDTMNPLSLRLSCTLTNGVIRIHLKRIDMLQDDANSLLNNLSKDRKKVKKVDYDSSLNTSVRSPIASAACKKRRTRIAETLDEREKVDTVITMVEDDGLIMCKRMRDEIWDSFDVDITTFSDLQRVQRERASEVVDVMVHAPRDFSPEVRSMVIEEATIAIQELSSIVIQNETMVIEEVPAVIEEVPAVIEEVPAVIEEVPAVIEEVPMVIEEVPMVIEEVPMVTEEVPMVTEEVPMVTEEVPSGLTRGKGKGKKKGEVVLEEVTGRKRLREKSVESGIFKVPKNWMIKTTMTTKINKLVFDTIFENAFKEFTGPFYIECDLFQEDCYDELEIRRTIEQVNVPEQPTPEIIIPNEVPAIGPDLPVAVPDGPAAVPDEPAAVPDEPAIFPDASSHPSAARIGVDGTSEPGSVESIIRKMSEWSLDQPMTIEDLCDKPYTKYKMTRIFAKVLALSWENKVVIKKDNNLELKAIVKGPEFPQAP